MERKPSRLISLHPLARITAYVILYWYANTIAIDTIWRIAGPNY